MARVRGQREVVKKLTGLMEQVPVAMNLALRDAAAAALEDADGGAPVEDGDLRESGYVQMGRRHVAKGSKEGVVRIVADPPPPPKGAVILKATIGFSADHALIQHEGVDLNHPRGGHPKFLERSINEHCAKLQGELADALGQAVVRVK